MAGVRCRILPSAVKPMGTVMAGAPVWGATAGLKFLASSAHVPDSHDSGRPPDLSSTVTGKDTSHETVIVHLRLCGQHQLGAAGEPPKWGGRWPARWLYASTRSGPAEGNSSESPARQRMGDSS